ncbi:MAG: alpha/beta hydrolase [Oscillospiraceae bacterium]|nr:alpha/beta hydrolase [Oscillospiraceae bacterium]
MLVEKFKTAVEGSGENAKLQTYIIDSSEQMKYNKRPLVLICPGGGYGFVSDREAEVMALQFTAMGYHAAVLTYSTYPVRYPTQILETAQAWKLIRDNSERWNVLPDKTVILGCSAGGHLAASYSLFCGEDFVTQSVGMTSDELRPAGMILCYPVITSGEFSHRDSFATLLGADYNNLLGTEILEKVSLEKQVTENAPPAFIWHTYTDNVVPVENSLLFASALRKHNVNCEMHIFPDGGHGLGLASELSQDSNGWGVQEECKVWIRLAEVWMKNKFGIGE